MGSNDMTQLTLGLDRDSGVVSTLFDERNDAVKALLLDGYSCREETGQICRDLRSGSVDDEDFAAWSMEEGIDSLSRTLHTVVDPVSPAELKK
ncbi:putative PEP-binding protein [Shigella flexneri]